MRGSPNVLNSLIKLFFLSTNLPSFEEKSLILVVHSIITMFSFGEDKIKSGASDAFNTHPENPYK